MAADGLVNRGNTLKEIGRVSEAIQDYIRAVTVRPTMAEGHANLASAYKDRYVSIFLIFLNKGIAIHTFCCSNCIAFLQWSCGSCY
jgi:tetratricopeptide (TPR) repeat protein